MSKAAHLVARRATVLVSLFQLPVIFLVRTPGLRTANRKNTLHPLIGASVAFNSGAIVWPLTGNFQRAFADPRASPTRNVRAKRAPRVAASGHARNIKNPLSAPPHTPAGPPRRRRVAAEHLGQHPRSRRGRVPVIRRRNSAPWTPSRTSISTESMVTPKPSGR